MTPEVPTVSSPLARTVTGPTNCTVPARVREARPLELKSAAAVLTAARRKAGKGFARAVQGQLKTLFPGGARIAVEVESDELGDDPMTPSPGEDGSDHVEIVFAPNPGEAPKPLRKIASGGELSRVTLAAKTVLAEVDQIPTLVFDEIDTGVGGRLGAVLGRSLADLAKHRQVLCITHLPQIASYADRHLTVRKSVSGNQTETTVRVMNGDERLQELSEMVGGPRVTETTRAQARELLESAQAEFSTKPVNKTGKNGKTAKLKS